MQDIPNFYGLLMVILQIIINYVMLQIMQYCGAKMRRNVIQNLINQVLQIHFYFNISMSENQSKPIFFIIQAKLFFFYLMQL